jgi:hypothetical protein
MSWRRELRGVGRKGVENGSLPDASSRGRSASLQLEYAISLLAITRLFSEMIESGAGSNAQTGPDAFLIA